MGNKLADLLLDSEIADAKRLAGQRDKAYQEGFQAGALAMRAAAAEACIGYGGLTRSEQNTLKGAAYTIRSIDPATLKGE